MEAAGLERQQCAARIIVGSPTPSPRPTPRPMLSFLCAFHGCTLVGADEAVGGRGVGRDGGGLADWLALAEPLTAATEGSGWPAAAYEVASVVLNRGDATRAARAVDGRGVMTVNPTITPAAAIRWRPAAGVPPAATTLVMFTLPAGAPVVFAMADANAVWAAVPKVSTV